ncbi:MAG: ATP-binding protein [Gemmatimonadota bacterium]|nr:ATP-binding protein [Gemmatimonadota bacterium]
MTDQPISVLLVDDDQVDRLSVRRALAKAGLGEVAITEAERADEAFAHISATAFDCAFFDFRLPDQDGVALLRNVRTAGVRTPVIVLTGFGDEQTVLDAMKAGATDYLSKSAVSPERIGQAVRAAIRLGSAERRAAGAKAAEERYANQLRGLADAAVALNNSASVGELLDAAAKHACLITGAPVAQVKLTGDAALELAEESGNGGWFSRADEARQEMSAAVSIPLPSRDGHAIGEMILDVWADRARDGFILDQLARLVGGALENVRLYRAAQRATQARDDVLAIVSHDLRNPLHTIVLSASYLADVFLADLPDAALQQTEIIRRAVDRANRLIQDLLDVSRIEAGGFSVNKEAVSPATIVSDAFEAMTSTANAANVTLESHTDDYLPDVCADRERLQQVFSNLVGNAIKFTPAGGTVVVTARASGPSNVCFSVKDSGQGISDDNLPHIFDRFWQARNAKRTGAGLGLAIARGIVEAHDGTVSAMSTLGLGTEISFELPTA